MNICISISSAIKNFGFERNTMYWVGYSIVLDHWHLTSMETPSFIKLQASSPSGFYGNCIPVSMIKTSCTEESLLAHDIDLAMHSAPKASHHLFALSHLENNIRYGVCWMIEDNVRPLSLALALENPSFHIITESLETQHNTYKYQEAGAGIRPRLRIFGRRS